jgi:hypothetical protein
VPLIWRHIDCDCSPQQVPAANLVTMLDDSARHTCDWILAEVIVRLLRIVFIFFSPCGSSMITAEAGQRRCDVRVNAGETTLATPIPFVSSANRRLKYDQVQGHQTSVMLCAVPGDVTDPCYPGMLGSHCSPTPRSLRAGQLLRMVCLSRDRQERH